MIDADVVRHVAELSRLGLDPPRLEALTADLTGILAHFETIQEVDTTGVEPLTHVLASEGRPAADVAAPFPDARETLLACTAHAREGFFVVPRVLEMLPDEGSSPSAPT